LILRNERGVAILMVLTAVALLAIVLADFSFETTVNQLKVYNQQDRTQARLNAEAGLNNAMARLRLYQEARNLLEGNENLQSMIPAPVLESILLMDFAFPIPIPQSAGAIQRSALQEFEQNTFFDGELLVQISQISGFLNPNNMRIIPRPRGQDNDRDRDEDRDSDETRRNNPAFFVEQQLVETLTRLIEDRRADDPAFDTRYGNLDPELLIKEIKFYISDPELFEDVERGEIEARYLAKDITPKHTPLTTIDELYLLEGWPDEIVDMFKSYLTVHEVAIISVNELTADLLKVLFPDISDMQIEEFFLFRRGDPEREVEGQDFKTPDDFKNVIVNRIGIMGDREYDERMRDFEAAGLRIGVAGKLFRVTSLGRKGRASVQLVAYVDLPLKPVPWRPQNQNDRDRDRDREPDEDTPPPQEDERPGGTGGGETEAPKPELLLPRIIEIRIE
jgi:type II secretory pathway component PulK